MLKEGGKAGEIGKTKQDRSLLILHMNELWHAQTIVSQHENSVCWRELPLKAMRTYPSCPYLNTESKLRHQAHWEWDTETNCNSNENSTTF